MLQRFAATGTGPHLLTWQVAAVVDPDELDPRLGRIEVWHQIVAAPPFVYPHVVVGFGPEGDIRIIAAAELMPGMHDACYLGVFSDGQHHNLGADDRMRDLTAFSQRAVPLVVGVLDPQQPDGPAAPPPPAMSRDEAMAELRSLRTSSPTSWAPTDPGALVPLLRRMRDLARALDLGSAAYEALARAAESPDDAELMFRAGYELVEVGLPDLAVAPLTRCLELLPHHGPTLDELALALEAASQPDEAARLLLAHPDVLSQRDSTRALASHYAAMIGDLATVRRLAGQLAADETWDVFRQRALARLDRADALAGVTPLDAGDLRGWEALLNGVIVLERSEIGDDSMNGRYGAKWDDEESFRQTLATLSAALDAADRRPTRVVAAGDRDSQVLGWALATMLGLGAPAHVDDAPGGPALVALYSWDLLDQQAYDRFANDPDAVLFAHQLNWTAPSSLAPDIVGKEAQALFPPWGERMRGIGQPGSTFQVTTIPADERDPHIVGSELAAGAGSAPPPGFEPALDLVRALRAVPHCVGLLGGRRDRFYPDGPVASARFV